MTTKIVIPLGDDMHCHLRTGKLLQSVANFTAWSFGRAVIMPNTAPPIDGATRVKQYRTEIMESAPSWFEPLMTIQLDSSTTPENVKLARQLGAVAGKVYPQGVTTNSENGVTNFKALYPVFEAMQKLGMLVLFHGEDPDKKITCLDRERIFLSTLYGIATDFPKLKIVLEHITTKDAVEMVKQLPNVAATITVHHLMLTIDDVVGGLLMPHNFCKPIAKMPEDKEALLKAATSGDPQIFFGSDSAPHLREKKECNCGCAGVFSAPVALPLLVQIFEEQGCLEKLNDFIGGFGADWYGIPRSTETIELGKKDWIVPTEYDGIVPFMAGKTLRWQIAS